MDNQQQASNLHLVISEEVVVLVTEYVKNVLGTSHFTPEMADRYCPQILLYIQTADIPELQFAVTTAIVMEKGFNMPYEEILHLIKTGRIFSEAVNKIKETPFYATIKYKPMEKQQEPLTVATADLDANDSADFDPETDIPETAEDAMAIVIEEFMSHYMSIPPGLNIEGFDVLGSKIMQIYREHGIQESVLVDYAGQRTLFAMTFIQAGAFREEEVLDLIRSGDFIEKGFEYVTTTDFWKEHAGHLELTPKEERHTSPAVAPGKPTLH